MRRLAILGASGHGKVVADTAVHAGWEQIVFFDDAWPGLQRNGSWSVCGNSNTLLETADEFEGIVIAIGNNHIRLKKYLQIEALTGRLISLIHPSAYVAADVVVGKGSVIFAGAVIQPGTKLGNACIVNTSATVDHDCILEDGVHISPGVHIAGSVIVGRCAWIGIGAAVIQNISIGTNAIVGAGAAVTSNVADKATVVGVPAVSKK